MAKKSSSRSKIRVATGPIVSRLSDNLTRLMAARPISLTELSHGTGIPMPTLKRFQSDPTANPTIGTLLPVARFFGVTVEDLYCGRL